MKYLETAKTARRVIWGAITSGAGDGAAICVMEKGEVVYSENFGLADRETGRPVGSASRFDVASVSKIFTTASCLILVDMGKLDIDRPIFEYIDDFEMLDERYRKITARMLFNHSSGLFGSCYNQAFCFEQHRDYQRHVLDTMKRSRLKHEPGEKSTYCNDGFTLAEILIERISGQKYIEFVTENILNKLNMKNTGPSVGTAGDVDVAETYTSANIKMPREVSPGVGMGGVSSTPEDLCRFGQSFCVNSSVRVLSEKSLELMLTPQPSKFCGKLRTRQEDCHMGWDGNIMDKYESRGVRVLYKGGLTWYATRFIVLPDLDVSIALSFSGGGPSSTPAMAILDAFLEEKGYGSFRKPVTKPPKPQPIPLELSRFAGIYVSGKNAFEISFERELITIKPLTGEDAAVSFIYNENYFYKKDDNNPTPHYFAEDGGMSFFAAENEHCADLVYQKLEYQNNPKQLDFDIDGKMWFNVNMRVRQFNWNGMFVVKSKNIKELPGYIDFAGVKLIESGSFAGSAGTYFRDQKDLALTEENGILTAYCADYILQDESILKSLEAGETEVLVPDSALNAVWYKTADGFILKIETDSGVTALVISPNGKDTLYASFLSDKEFYAPAGSFVVFYGVGRGKVCAE